MVEQKMGMCDDDEQGFEEREVERIANLVESPLQAYARYLARKDITDPRYAQRLRIKKPVTKLVLADWEYAWRTYKNRILVINGSTGTLKSFQGLSMANKLDRNGFWTHRLGNYDLPKLFYTQMDMVNYAQSDDYREGSCLLQDEEASQSGVGVRGMNSAMMNLERTVARYSRMNIIFIYVVEKSHQANTLFYTRGEHYSPAPLADYGGLGVLQPMASKDQHQLLGICTFDVPPQGVIDAYHKKKTEFVEGMRESGGYGIESDIIKKFAAQIKKMEKDANFLKIPHKGNRAAYASQKYHVPNIEMGIILDIVDFDYTFE